MPNENTALLDALEFKRRLINRINDASDEDGMKIKEYLDNVVPRWWTIRSTRLYKHLQKMLGNAEGIRRFEIDLIWKRVVYVISLMVISFTAFGGVFYMIYDTDYTIYGEKIEVDKNKETLLFFVLFLIALVNAFLSFCLAMMNIASRHWQSNWEYHVDYLQTILEVKMIRANLVNMPKYFTIGRMNILISVFMFTVWLFVAVILLVFSIHFFQKFELVIIAVCIIVLVVFVVLFFLIFEVYKFLVGESFWDERDEEPPEKMKIKLLQKLCFEEKRTPPSKKYGWGRPFVLLLVILALSLVAFCLYNYSQDNECTQAETTCVAE